MKWILVANSNACLIYQYEKKEDSLSLIKTIDHPENKLKTSELVTDTTGRYKASSTVRGAYSQETDPHDVQIDNFSREIAHVLDDGRKSNKYNDLIFFMPSHMDGLVMKHLNKHVADLISKTIQKNIIQFTPHELLGYIRHYV